MARVYALVCETNYSYCLAIIVMLKPLWVCSCMKEDKTIYLIFSVHGSNYFQGIARITGPVSTERVKEFHSPGLGGTIPVQWIKRYG